MVEVGNCIDRDDVIGIYLSKQEVERWCIERLVSIQEDWQNKDFSFGVSDIIMNLGIIIVEASLKTLWVKGKRETLKVIGDS